MKSWVLFAAMLLLSSPATFDSTRYRTGKTGTDQTYAPQDELPLRLTTNVLSQRYCREEGSDSSDNLRLKLRLQYTNVGSEPLIIYKHENSVFREMVSRNAADAAAHKYLWDFSVTSVTEGRLPTLDRGLPEDRLFVVLRPAQAFEGEAEITVFVRRGLAGNQSDGLLAGDYLLEVSVSTWPVSQDLAELLRQRWKGIGLLWFRDLNSEPMLFRIEKNPKLENCSDD